MNAVETGLPSLHLLEAALRKTTERIAAEVAAPDGRTPDWSEMEWRVAMAAAVMHGVSALLAKRSSWRGPAFWQSFLAEQAEQTALRQERIESLLARMHLTAQSSGVSLVALKGSSLLKLGLYGHGERPMSDIDLLVRDEAQAGAAQMLETLDYRRDLQTWKHLLLLPHGMPAEPAFGEHADNAVKIDLHTRVYERLPVHEIDISASIWPPRAEPGVLGYPSKAALMRHLLLHSAGNLMSGGLRLIQLQDLALLAPRLSVADWAEVLGEDGQGRTAWWAIPPLMLVRRYFADALPASIAVSLDGRCPRRLRASMQRSMLSDVSLSQLWIEAFPGLAWSSTPLEALTLMKRRVFPEASLRPAAVQHVFPSAMSRAGSWNRMPHLRKILRGLAARPPRVFTLYTVQRAMSHGVA